MQVIVEITSDSSTGKKQIRIQPGQTVSVGRTTRADFPLPQDTYLSGVHFALEFESDACRLRDLNSSNGTFINGKQISEATLLREGDKIAAGRTTFVVHLEADENEFASPVTPQTDAAAPLPTGMNEPQTLTYNNRLLEILRGQPAPLFALLDAARDARVLELLRASKEKYQSLYEGEQGKLLDDYAPYLLSLPPKSDFLETLVSEGWGKSWGLFLTCDKQFAQLRRYLRRFLLVKDESGRELYFRFYDPRVMRVYLPTCTPAETTRMFGPISRYLIEAAEPDVLLQFTESGQGAEQQRVSLVA
jgi:hypothetical protein